MRSAKHDVLPIFLDEPQLSLLLNVYDQFTLLVEWAKQDLLNVRVRSAPLCMTW